MSPPNDINFPTTQQKQDNTNFSLGAIGKSLASSGLILFLFYIFLFETNRFQGSNLLANFKLKFPSSSSISTITSSPTNISHIVFGIVGSMNTWRHKKSYSESWWRQNVTRGYLFFERPPSKELLPWPSSSPPFRVNENITAFDIYRRLENPGQVRLFRTILETFRQGDKDVRWYVMADDDTIFSIDNLVDVLAKYDHTKYYYVGTSSECIAPNFVISFDMAFGGAGYALSYPLAAAVAANLDTCLERYPRLPFSDLMLYTCLADLGVALTRNTGFHQIDLHKDISGLLSSHPQTPFVSLHHIDAIDPIFPNKSRADSVNRLMAAAKADHSRLLQQTICHHRRTNWTFSVAWGYSVHIYESILPRSFLRKPIETFRPWRGVRPPLYVFNTRLPTADPCEAPHALFFDSVENSTVTDDHDHDHHDEALVTTYVRVFPRNLPACSSAGNHSADRVVKIRVFSPAKLPLQGGGRECCDVVHSFGSNTTDIKYRPCINNEITA